VALLGEVGREERISIGSNSDHRTRRCINFGLWKEVRTEPRLDGKIASPGTKGKKGAQLGEEKKE